MSRHHRWLAACWLAAVAGFTVLVGAGPAHAGTETASAYRSWAGPNQPSSYSASYSMAAPSDATAPAVSPLNLCDHVCKPPEKPCDHVCKPPVKPCDHVCKPTVKPTEKPTVKPTEKPTEKPTVKPTEKPTVKPTEKPTVKPSPTEDHQLPVTGTPVGLVAGGGFTLAALGVGMLVWGRRRSIRQ
jgi:outer membrane biosynthesis protein TonB